MKSNFFTMIYVVATLVLQSCGNPSSYENSLSYTSPPVMSAVPKSLHGATSSIVMPFSSTSINEQFFGSGTTSIYSLLTKLDNLISKFIRSYGTNDDDDTGVKSAFDLFVDKNENIFVVNKSKLKKFTADGGMIHN